MFWSPCAIPKNVMKPKIEPCASWAESEEPWTLRLHCFLLSHPNSRHQSCYLRVALRSVGQQALSLTMNFSVLFFFLLATVAALPTFRFTRQAYYPQNNWGYNPSYQRGSGLWRFGGMGGPSGEGSTWEGGNTLNMERSKMLFSASASGISNNDISIFG